MAIETGVVLGMQDNLSPTARKVAGELDNITKSADGINSAFDPKYLDDYNKKLVTIGDSYTKLNSQISNQNQSALRQAQSMMSGVSTGVVSAGRGDIGGAALAGGKGLSGLASTLFGTAGGIAAGALMAGGVAGNALANQYSQRAGPAQKIAALQDRLYTDINDNTEALRSAMEETVNSVTQFGKTYEEGARATETFLRAGGTDFRGGRAAEYSMAYGADFGALSSFAGKTQRFGQSGGLDTTRALMRAQGLGPAQFEEVMGGLGDTFSQSLSQGIIKSLPDIARSQEFIARAGQTFQGGLGAQRLQGMNQVVSGAGGLQSQSDLFLYRAAQKMSGGGILETRKLMEQGLTPEMFQGLMGEFDRFGYGRDESIMQLSKMFGLSITSAEELYDLKGQKALTTEQLSKGMKEGSGRTRESEYLRIMEAVKQAIAGVAGGKAFDARGALVGGGESLVEFFKGKLGDVGDAIKADEIITETIKVEKLQIANVVSTDAFGAEVYTPLANMAGARPGYSQLKNMIDEARIEGVTEVGLYGALRDPYSKAISRSGPGGANITDEELKTLGGLLQDLIEATNKTTDAILEPVVVDTGTDPALNERATGR